MIRRLLLCLAALLLAQPAAAQVVTGISFAGLPHIGNNAGLAALPSTAYPSIVRDGFAAVGDAPALAYTASNSACSLNAGAGDNGSQVRASDGKCWLANFPDAGMDVREFGAKVDGSTSDSSVIQAAITAAAGNGLTVIAPAGVSAIATGLTVGVSNTKISGCGSGGYQQGNPQILAAACSRWKWTGSSGGTMLQFTSPSGGQGQVGGGVSGLFLDGENTAGFGLTLKSWRWGRFSDIVVYQATTAGYLLTQQTGLSTVPTDDQYNNFSNFKYITGSAAGNAARGLWLVGGAASTPNRGNSSLNTFINGELETNDTAASPALELDDADDNYFYGVSAGCFGCVTSTNYMVVLGSGDQDQSGGGNPARYNFMYFLISPKSIAMAGQSGGASSHDNEIFGYSLANSIPDMTLQAGAGGSSAATASVFYSDGRVVAAGKLQASSGSWTPTLSLATPGTSSFSYSTQTGSYTCSAGNVTATFKTVATPTIGTGAGTLLVGGMPLSIASPGTFTGSQAFLAGAFTGLSSLPYFIGGQDATHFNVGTETGTSASAIAASNLTGGSASTILSSISYQSASGGC